MRSPRIELTEEQKQEIKNTFKTRRNRQLMVSAPMIVIIVGAAFFQGTRQTGALGFSEDAAGIIFVAIVLAVLAFSFGNWRCPSCNKYLGKTVNPKFCAKCGVPLQ